MIDVILAVAPAIVLLAIIYCHDTREKEPLGLVLRVFVAGAISVIPTALVEYAMNDVIGSIFVYGTLSYVAVDNLIGVALVEEGFKFLAIYLLVWKHVEFDHVFDGVVYGVAAALGFAMIENIMYVCQSTDVLGVAFSRAIFSVPGHMCDGIFMGLCLGFAKYHKFEGRDSRKRLFVALSLLIPIIEHGIYDGILSIEADWKEPVFYVFVIIVYVVAFIVIQKFRGVHDQPIHVPKPAVPATVTASAASPAPQYAMPTSAPTAQTTNSFSMRPGAWLYTGNPSCPWVWDARVYPNQWFEGKPCYLPIPPR